MTRPPAPDLTADEARKVAEFEAAPVLEEAWRGGEMRVSPEGVAARLDEIERRLLLSEPGRRLVAAVRAVADLADDLEGRYLPMSPAAGQAWDIAAELRAALTSALSGRDDHTEEAGR